MYRDRLILSSTMRLASLLEPPDFKAGDSLLVRVKRIQDGMNRYSLFPSATRIRFCPFVEVRR